MANTFTLPSSVNPIEAAISEQPLEVPDIIDWVTKPQWLNRPRLYPRQATLLKIIFLQDELFTDYDYQVIEEWTGGFNLNPTPNSDGIMSYEGFHGLQPDILDRIRINKAAGRKWFKECIVAIGRRGSKGYLGALCGSYVLWHYMSWGLPQEHYGIAQEKPLQALIYAGKLNQAKAEQFGDLRDVILGSNCFAPYIAKSMGESLLIRAPGDTIRMEQLKAKNIKVANPDDLATFHILPKESTLMSGRGPTSFIQFYDEMAHVTKTSAKNSAEEVYCLDPTTRVLDMDLRWRPIGEIKVGDLLVGFDEYADTGKQRKMRETKVLGVTRTVGSPVRVHFDDGTFVVCSKNHRWFRTDTGTGRWASVDGYNGRTERGDGGGRRARIEVGSQIRWITDPWEEDTSKSAGWLAGIFDGEGHISNGSAFRIGVSQNPGLVLDAIHGLLDERGFQPQDVTGKTLCRKLQINGLGECLRLLGQLRPYRLLEQHRKLWLDKAPRGQIKYKTVVKIEELPLQELVDIETSTSTFIAEGLVSHNSAATPSLDQFGVDGFLWEGSSTWQMMGQFYENWRQSLQLYSGSEEHERGEPVYPEKFMVQLESWDPYKDWRIAHTIKRRKGWSKKFDPLDRAIQEYDDAMRRLEQANPETFKVERRSRWAASMQAYLNPDRIRMMWEPWQGKELEMQIKGHLHLQYAAHVDPSKSGANTGLAVAHVVGPDERGYNHVIFDLIKHWQPGDFPNNNNEIDYIFLEDWWNEYVTDAFMPENFTFDQFETTIIQRVNRYARSKQRPKSVRVFERTATKKINWQMAEGFKTALGLGLLHAPYYQQADLEMIYLEDLGNERVDHPTMGPIQTKDVFDAMANVTYTLIGKEMMAFLGQEFTDFGIRGANQGGTQPFSKQFAGDNAMTDAQELFSHFGRANTRAGGALAKSDPSRQMSRSRPGRWSPSSPWNRQGR